MLFTSLDLIVYMA